MSQSNLRRISDSQFESCPPAGQPLPPYLMRRGNVYYFKRKISAPVVRALRLAEKEVWTSLATTDFDVALERREQELRSFEARFSKSVIRERLGPRWEAASYTRSEGTSKYLLPEYIPSILERYAHGVLTLDDEERRTLDRDERAERLELLNCALEQRYEAAAADDIHEVADLAAELLALERVIAAPGCHALDDLLRQLLQRDIELLEIQRGRLQGKMHLSPKALPAGPRELFTLLDVYHRWVKTQKILRTRDAYRSFVQAFEQSFGALPVVAIARDHAEGFRDLLKEQGFVRDTVQNRAGALATLVEFGRSENLYALAENPFVGLSYKMIPTKPAHEVRRAFTVRELQLLLNSAVYTSGERSDGQARESCFWAPLMGPFVGARIEEICQLRIEDILCINGSWALRIANLDEDQNLKTETSFRYVPLHEELIRCGFLAYAAAVKRVGHERLFPSQRNANRHKLWSNALGKWFTRYLDRVGIKDARVSYHSFRYNFRQNCVFCGIDHESRDALTGHWLDRKEAGATYLQAELRQYPYPALVNAMAAFRYDELDLSHLHVADPYDGVAEAFGVRAADAAA